MSCRLLTFSRWRCLCCIQSQNLSYVSVSCSEAKAQDAKQKIIQLWNRTMRSAALYRDRRSKAAKIISKTRREDWISWEKSFAVKLSNPKAWQITRLSDNPANIQFKVAQSELNEMLVCKRAQRHHSYQLKSTVRRLICNPPHFCDLSKSF